MTTRNDITLDYTLSPRVARIAAPEVNLSLQDYVDTLRVAESQFQGMSYPFLINASGKEDLGDGVLVGITVQEQNLRLAFESRRTPAIDEGTVTTGSGAPNLQNRYVFVDTGADFVTAGVEPGSLVINWTDRSMADVVEVIDANTIRMEALVNGTDNEMGLGDVYSIFNIIQVRVSAGNLTAIDDLAAAINSVLPTAFTQVVVAQASNSTLINANLTTVESQVAEIHGQVQRSIFIDTEALTNGNGYQQTPYNNWTDAVDDAEANGIKNLVLLADATVDRQLKNFEIIGVGRPQLDINGQTIDGCEVIGCEMTGAMVGEVIAKNCGLNNVTGMNGHFTNCDLNGTCGIATAGVVVMDGAPHSAIAGLSRPFFDMNAASTGAKFSLRGYSGGLTLFNCNHGDDEVTLEFAQGKCTLASSCTAGVISVRGIAQFTDQSAGSVVDTTALLSREIVENDVWDASIADHTTAGTFGDFITRRILTVAKFFGLK
jgi:hypothetical protein